MFQNAGSVLLQAKIAENILVENNSFEDKVFVMNKEYLFPYLSSGYFKEMIALLDEAIDNSSFLEVGHLIDLRENIIDNKWYKRNDCLEEKIGSPILKQKLNISDLYDAYESNFLSLDVFFDCTLGRGKTGESSLMHYLSSRIEEGLFVPSNLLTHYGNYFLENLTKGQFEWVNLVQDYGKKRLKHICNQEEKRLPIQDILFSEEEMVKYQEMFFNQEFFKGRCNLKNTFVESYDSLIEFIDEGSRLLVASLDIDCEDFSFSSLYSSGIDTYGKGICLALDLRKSDLAFSLAKDLKDFACHFGCDLESTLVGYDFILEHLYEKIEAASLSHKTSALQLYLPDLRNAFYSKLREDPFIMNDISEFYFDYSPFLENGSAISEKWKERAKRRNVFSETEDN